MRSDRVEIPQDRSMKILVGMGFVTNDFLIDLFGVAIRRECLLDRCGLVHRQMSGIRLAINRARRREDEVLHAMQFHNLQERNKAAEIIAVIQQRFLYGLAYRFAGSEMNHTHYIRIVFENAIQIYEIAAVNIGEFRLFTYNSSYSVQHINGGIAQVIYDSYIIALLHQFDRCMRTYITGTSGNKYTFIYHFIIYHLFI